MLNSWKELFYGYGAFALIKYIDIKIIYFKILKWIQRPT